MACFRRDCLQYGVAWRLNTYPAFLNLPIVNVYRFNVLYRQSTTDNAKPICWIGPLFSGDLFEADSYARRNVGFER